MTKQLWIDLLETLTLSLKCPAKGAVGECKVEDWIREQSGRLHNRVCDLEQKVDILQSHRSAIAGLSTQIVELARRVTELEKRPLMDQDLAAVFEITKRHVNDLLQFRQQHSRFHDQMDRDVDRMEKNLEQRWKDCVANVIRLERRLSGDTVKRDEAIRDAGEAGSGMWAGLGDAAGGREGGVPALAVAAGHTEKNGEDG